MKRAWTKKVKSLPSCAVGKDALEGQLKSQPKVKWRVFRTSAAMIGLTVSVGTPNFLLTQAAQVPEGISSEPAPIKDSAAPETVQNILVVAPSPAMLVPAVVTQVAATPSSYSITERQPAAKKVAEPSYNQPAPVLQLEAPEVDFTPELQQSSPIEAQAPIVKQNVRAILRQHQQAAALEQTQTTAIPVATSITSGANPLGAQFQDSEKTEIPPSQAIIAPIQINTASSSSLEVPQLAVSPEANSDWTAKQRLLVNRLKNQENSVAFNREKAVQVISNANLANSDWTAKQRLLVNRLKNQENPAPSSYEVVKAPSNAITPVTTNNQLTVETQSAPVVAIPSPEQKQALQEKLAGVAPVVASTSDDAELAVPLSLATEAIVLPSIAQNNQDLVIPSKEITQPLPELTATREQLAQTPEPVFVLPEVSVAPQIDTAPVEVKAVNEQQVTTEYTTKEPETTPVIKVVPTSVSEYQVKPGDTLTNIAYQHRVSLPAIAKFNHLPNLDLLLVDQRLKIPTLTASIKNQVQVAVLPPIEKVEPLADANSLKVALVSTEQKLIPVDAPASVYTGVGGSISGEEVEAKPLEQPALNNLQAQYAQKLQNDVQELKHKYYAPNSTSSIVPIQAGKGDRLQSVIKPSLNLGDEPINPEFRVAQTSEDLKPAPQKQLLDRGEYSAPATVKGRVATAPVSVDNSEEFFQGRQVTPELPPLAPALNYLPQPNGVAPFDGYIWPAKGVLTSPYGWRWGRMHRGIDIAAPVGTPVFAASSGVVIKAGWNKGGYGNLVDIQHSDGTLTRYAHNYRLLVQPGQFIEQGQQISLMGSTGRSTGPHLHFEVHPGGKGAVNPIALLPKNK